VDDQGSNPIKVYENHWSHQRGHRYGKNCNNASEKVRAQERGVTKVRQYFISSTVCLESSSQQIDEKLTRRLTQRCSVRVVLGRQRASVELQTDVCWTSRNCKSQHSHFTSILTG